MFGWLRNLGVTLIVLAVALAIYKMYGGDLTGFLTLIYDVLWGIVDAVSNVMVKAWTAVFGS
jgi:hypothetical protein